MKLCRLPWFCVVKIPTQKSVAFLTVSLVIVGAAASVRLASAQSVSFAGAESVLPTNGLLQPENVALDGAGDVFLSDYNDGIDGRVVELPRTAAGYGPQTTLPFTGLSGPVGVVLDSAGDVFATDFTNSDVVELPKTETGYGPQTTLPFSGLDNPIGITVDSAGDVFISDYVNDRVLELPKTSTGYNPQTTLPFSGLYPLSVRDVALDKAGDVFLVDTFNDRVLELPRTATGYGPQATLPFNGLFDPYGVALDDAGDVFVGDLDNQRVVELPKAATGYGPQTTLPFSGLSRPYGVVVDGGGDVFVVDDGNNNVHELQTVAVNFGGASVCAPGMPATCGVNLTLNYRVNADVTLDAPKVLTGGAPNLDFELAGGSTCTGMVAAGTTCTVNVIFAPLSTGIRNGVVEIIDGGGNDIVNTSVYGTGVALGALQITSLNANYGAWCAIETLTGAGFRTNQGASTVTFNSISAPVLSWSDTSIAVSVPYRATSGNVVVTVGGQASNAVAFTVEPTPSIAEILPASGAAGSQVTIIGQNLLDAEGHGTVYFDGEPLSLLDQSSDGILVEIPANAISGVFDVHTNGVGMYSSVFTVTGLPQINSASANYGADYSIIVLTGTNFGARQGSSAVTFNGVPAPVLSWSTTGITVSVPYRATSGHIVVTVGGQASNGIPFTVEPTPSITGISPSSGPAGTVVTISGANLLDAEGHGTVYFSGVSLPILNPSATSVQVEVPAGAASGVFDVHINGVGNYTPVFTVN